MWLITLEEAMETEVAVKEEKPEVAVTEEITEVTVKEDKPEVNGAGAASAVSAKKKKSKYLLPVRLEVQVSVAEIEWQTECTNEALQTNETTNTSQFGLPTMKIVDA